MKYGMDFPIKRGNKNDATLNIKLPHEAKADLEQIAERLNVSVAGVVRYAIGYYLSTQKDVD